NYHNAGDSTTLRIPLAVLAAVFNRLGRSEPAATIAGFALSPIAAAGVPEITTAIAHLRDVLGEATYESLARKGETMTTAAMATYAYDQIDQARTELNAVSK
ncbi:MAG TPA: adenylate/guanylate cyclase domain-containing protein, partial [Mycobacterium sp.]|nr:adenylate/guanylate cyclase domain-containing protein [Mycobacterium sp.]